MQSIWTGLVVMAATVMVPAAAWADNQQMADQIAAKLRDSGQLQGYKIGIKYQEGTAWLQGQVRSQQQMKAAMKLAFEAPGVSRVVNKLSVNEATASSKPQPSSVSRFARTKGQTSGVQNPLRSANSSLASNGLRQLLPGQSSPSAAAQPIETPQPVSESQAAIPQTASQGVVQTSHPRTPVVPVANRQPVGGNPMPVGYMQPMGDGTTPIPAYVPGVGGGVAPAQYDEPNMPNYAWPSYASYPNYAALTYPKQYSATAWPYIGPFYPYPQVPLGWRKVTLEWDDGWWHLDFKDDPSYCCWP